MEFVKSLSIALASTSLMVLATLVQAKASVTLEYERTFGQPGTGDGEIFLPQGITVQDTTGNVFISDGENDRLQVFDSQGNYIKSIGSSGSGPGQFDEPADLKFDSLTGNLYVGDVFNNRINVFDSQGNYLKSFAEFGGPIEGRIFYGPGGLSFGNDGNLYVTDFSNDYIQVFNRDGEFLRTIGSSGSEPGQFLGPSGITVSPTSGNIFVSDQINNRVQVLNPEGEAILVFGQSGSEPGQFNQPIGLEVDEFENIYVSDSQNNRVQVFDKNGNFLSSYGTSVANPGPSSILAPGQPLPEPGVFNWTAGAHYNDGKLYVGDFFNSRVLQLDVKRTAVPEPTSALGLGLLGLSAAVHLRKKKHHKVAILGRSAIFLSCSTAKE